jgi:hypothetical protein
VGEICEVSRCIVTGRCISLLLLKMCICMFMFSNASEFSCDIINYCDLCMLFRNRTCMAEGRYVRPCVQLNCIVD